MIENYVSKLIHNLPESITNTKEPIRMDLVLDGGLFNGSYLIGALYFLKEMEKQKYIVIERISGCSIGSIVALLYYMDALDNMCQLYEIIKTDLSQSHQFLKIKELQHYLKEVIPEDLCKRVNNKLYITHNNIENNTKIVTSKYDTIDDLFNTITKSCFIPFLIDGNFVYENKYIDGINPHIFDIEPNKKILHLNLFGFDKIAYLFNVKNEKTNIHRVLTGLLDIHSFFIKQHDTSMCSYVNDWGISNRLLYLCKTLFEKICVYITHLMYSFKYKIPDEYHQHIVTKLTLKIIQDVFVAVLENYCL